MIRPWKEGCQTSVAHMQSNDFYGSEKSHTMAHAGNVRIEHVAEDGTVTVLKAETQLEEVHIYIHTCMHIHTHTYMYVYI